MSDADTISNVLAERYASPQMKALWSPRGRILLERDLWIAVMKAQRDLGLSIPQEAIEAYEAAREDVRPDAIREREAVTRHDVKARIEEFNERAGHEHIHKGMTSRDLTENVEQMQVHRSLGVVLEKGVAALTRLSALAAEHRDLLISARTHNVAAQPTTFGKRVAMFGEELLRALERLEATFQRYPARGIKGAVGTQVDMLTLFEGDSEKVAELESKIAEYLGINGQFDRLGQVYPRSLDFEVVSGLTQLAAGPSSFALTLRLMAGHETASEGFAKGQTGSSAMPHKMNARSCERINGFKVILDGYNAMAGELAGRQWNEGDVSCSVVRRVMLPDAFFAADGLFETFLTVLDQMEVFAEVIEQENDRYLPFLSTTTILMEAVKAGSGREAAHKAIKEHALATVADMRSGAVSENDLLDRLASDDRLNLDRQTLQGILDRAPSLTGNAAAQVDGFVRAVESWKERYPAAAEYQPGSIL